MGSLGCFDCLCLFVVVHYSGQYYAKTAWKQLKVTDLKKRQDAKM